MNSVSMISAGDGSLNMRGRDCLLVVQGGQDLPDESHHFREALAQTQAHPRLGMKRAQRYSTIVSKYSYTRVLPKLQSSMLN